MSALRYTRFARRIDAVSQSKKLFGEQLLIEAAVRRRLTMFITGRYSLHHSSSSAVVQRRMPCATPNLMS